MAYSMVKKFFFLLFFLEIWLIPIPTFLPTPAETKSLSISENQPIGSIKINKINLIQPLYKVESKENTIEKNVTILKESSSPEEENSILILAAHSGTGKIAYFEDLDQLEIQDEIEIIYNQKNYYYEVKEIWEEKKNGFIHINKEEKKQLILTTCSPKKENYQLIVNCIEKKS